MRYNNEIMTLSHPLLTLWQQQGRLIAICPEVAGGLLVPREPAEQDLTHGKVMTRTGINVTEEFNDGAQQSLALCKQHHIRFAMLKESSPSCGSTLIYDGSFSNQKVSGQGVTSRLLIQAGIKVFSENHLTVLAKLLDK